MGEIREQISYNIRAYRLANKMTQKELADSLGVKVSTVSTWERGANAPDIEMLFKICRLFCVSVSEMYGKNVECTDSESIFQPSTLTPDEQKLIDDYRDFNDEGKEKVRDYVADLSDNPKYKKRAESVVAQEA